LAPHLLTPSAHAVGARLRSVHSRRCGEGISGQQTTDQLKSVVKLRRRGNVRALRFMAWQDHGRELALNHSGLVAPVTASRVDVSPIAEMRPHCPAAGDHLSPESRNPEA
jgi:hypothetical protein